mmetsp:Transcript_116970/g.365736  ORF Transcript_116970/g.365736 Transcript_116970/m.365736 type:complete len:83 (+) Transcript_116970:275-523(+)
MRLVAHGLLRAPPCQLWLRRRCCWRVTFPPKASRNVPMDREEVALATASGPPLKIPAKKTTEVAATPAAVERMARVLRRVCY